MIRSLPLALVALALTASAAVADAPAAFTLDANHSNVNFSVRHLGISKVRGTFATFTADILADPANGHLSKVVGTVDTASVDTGNEGRDKHLRSDDFFHSEAFPQMKLEADNIKWIGDRFLTQVKLTIRDQTHMVPFSGELLGRQEGNLFGKDQVRVGYSATGKIDRQKFGLKFNRLAEGVSVVGNEVTIELEIQASRLKAAE